MSYGHSRDDVPEDGQKSDVGNEPARKIEFVTSAYIKCDCNHPAYLHSAGACGGYALKDEYKYPSVPGRLDSAYCNCQRNHYQVIDEWIANFLSSRPDEQETS